MILPGTWPQTVNSEKERKKMVEKKKTKLKKKTPPSSQSGELKRKRFFLVPGHKLKTKLAFSK